MVNRKYEELAEKINQLGVLPKTLFSVIADQLNQNLEDHWLSSHGREEAAAFGKAVLHLSRSIRDEKMLPEIIPILQGIRSAGEWTSWEAAIDTAYFLSNLMSFEHPFLLELIEDGKGDSSFKGSLSRLRDIGLLEAELEIQSVPELPPPLIKPPMERNKVSKNIFSDKIKASMKNHRADKSTSKASSEILFCCFAIEDKDRVENIYNRLKKDGYSPWMSSKDIVGGQNWQHEIRKVMRDSDLILAFISENSAKKSGYVQKELRQSLEIQEEKSVDEIFVIPIKLDEIEVPDLFVRTIELRNLQWIDFFEEDGYQKLLEAIDLQLLKQKT